ncbi:MAG: VOC family protein [Microcoleus sp.]
MRNIDRGLTHIALPVSDVDRSIEFYSKYAGMQVVHRRIDAEAGVSVVWLSDRTRPFVIVLIQTDSRSFRFVSLCTPGELAARAANIWIRSGTRARQEGVLIQEQKDSGYPIGYWAFLRDPDGHTRELSRGQEIGFTVEDAT